MTPREERREKMRAAVCTAAMQAVVEEGLEGLTIARLAARLGVSVGGLYRYYPGKEAILVALERQALAQFDQLMEERLRRFERRLARDGISPPVAALGRLLAAAGTFPAHARRAPAEHRLLDLVLSSPEHLLADEDARALEASLAPILHRTAALLEGAVAARALAPGDAALRTSALWAAMHGVGHFEKRDRLLPPALHARHVARALVDGLLTGWGARPAELAAAHDLA